MSPLPSFHWYDYIIYVTILAISASIGIYLGCCRSKKMTAKEYIMGKGKMKTLPVALSITVSHFSGITLTSIPAEVYKYGAYSIFICLSMALVASLTVLIYLPVFFNLQLISIYEYMERRFDRRTRLLASFLYILCEIIFDAFVIYSPSLALSAATGINVTVISLGTFCICAFYTAIGGLKTVIWTDSFQFGVVMVCLVVIWGIGLNAEGGFAAVWHKALEGGRLDIFDSDLDPTRRDSFWIYTIGYTLYLFPYISLSQGSMQKFLTLGSFRDCVWSAIYFATTVCLVEIFCVSIGLLLYARYSECDLLLSQKIARHDQMVAYYVLDITRNIPGMSGLFFATLCCASLSSISCSLNAMAGVIYRDFVSRFLSEKVNEEKATGILKSIVIICGLICICLLLIMQHVKEIFPLLVNLLGIISGPVLGIFTMGVLLPQVNANGAFFGTIGGFISLAIIVILKRFYHSQYSFVYPSKSLSTLGCGNNFTITNSSYNSTIIDIQNSTVPYLFRISHIYNCFLGAVITIILAMIISKLTGNQAKEVDEKLISPIVRRFFTKKVKNDAKALENLVEGKTEVKSSNNKYIVQCNQQTIAPINL